jgi:hypothetical protein
MSDDGLLTGCAVLPPMTTGPATSPLPRPAGREKAKRAAGRFASLNAFLDATLRHLTRTEAAVWLLLFRDTKADGLARTGQADLARRAGCNVGTVKRALAKLAGRGLLIVVRRGRIGAGPSIYRLRPTSTDQGRAGATIQGRIRRRK